MSGILLGLIAGTYLNNPNFRRTIENAAKELFGKSVDMLNANSETLTQTERMTENE